ncbi:MAG: hypothetical protein COT24_01260 [Candidatus Kerfeldbacteria bacterium CG08_land_8_20_14_0_20_40_16]|uniref:DUF3850 domain-containing protein n=1 Tax=Candidatus Kerfeldbacteria bacterium CG08_land_8_20_14_0_20_40_16 TaxID=2014244 RepID=A0A2H0YWN2_9BACT|nr:MAG: hypothetical protein COT24_01260 [Candidatus Kerfeldbacteria bacterium CG08_land_8_20_14_0_20_40_16]
MAKIEKKCWPEWYEKFSSGERTLELRLADFKLKDGDILVLKEYDPINDQYSGRETEFVCKKVEHSAQNPLQFYDIEDVEEKGFWIIQLEKKN